jgi:hypothetical protein
MPRGLTYLCTEKAGYINSAPLYICRVVLFLLRQRCGAGFVFLTASRRRPCFFDSVVALALASCNEHVAEANVSRPQPPTPRVLSRCPPKAQSSRGQRNNLTFSKHPRTTCFPNSRDKLPHGVSYIFPPPRPFSPACSPPPSCFFARDCTPATTTALAAAAGTLATTTRISTSLTCSNTMPRAASTYHARCSSISSPA